MTTSFKTHPVSLKDLMRSCHEGRLQLPDFQRGWVWDQDRIIDLLASISNGFPVGALMTLNAAGETVFAVRPVEGAPLPEKPLEAYLLDGQQRMTSLYQSTSSSKAVVTQTAKKQPAKLHFYFNIRDALNPNVSRRDAILAVPEDKVIKENFGRKVVLDLSDHEKEFESLHFPIGRIFDAQNWIQKALTWVLQDMSNRQDHMKLINDFSMMIVNNFTDYQVPVIELGKDTSRAAVCLVFEKVNTGGKALDAFELVTAMYAGQEFQLRDDWKKRREKLVKQPVLAGIEPVEFLQAISLLYTKALRTQAEDEKRDPPAISATRNSLLQLPLSAYKAYADKVEKGYETAAKFLYGLRIFRARDLPYQTQLVPLAAILAQLGSNWENDAIRQRLAQWYWCGVFGELYGSAVESRFALDVRDFGKWITDGEVPQTIQRADFREERLRTLRTRLSAAYKGVNALLMQSGAEDFRSGQPFGQAVFFDESVDIHHIFPEAWCKAQKIKPEIYNSVINKTPLSARTNRMIGGIAPSSYLAKIESGSEANPAIPEDRLQSILKSHEIDMALLAKDNFQAFFDSRRSRLLALIEKAMGKPAVCEDVAPPDPDDTYTEEELEVELADASLQEVVA
jgi:hypothetical protein